LKESRKLLGRNRGARVGNLQDRLAKLTPDGQPDRAAGPVVSDGVLEQVEHESFDQARLAEQPGGLKPAINRNSAHLGLAEKPVGDIPGDDVQLDRRRMGDPPLPLSQCQKGVDQPLLLFVLLQHLLTGLPECARAGVGIAQHHFHHRANGGERSAQLVGGVGHEPALSLEGAFQSAQQSVDRVSELPELIARAGQGKTPMKVGLRDLLGGGCDRPQRPEHSPRHQPAEQPGDERHDGQRDSGFDLELMQVGHPLLVAHEAHRPPARA
jgi:hypothetical protein